MSLLELTALISIPLFTFLSLYLTRKFFPHSKHLSISRNNVVIIGSLIFLAALGQWAMGRELFGNMDLQHLISLDTKSPYNSQTLFDQYAFSHIIHGFILFYFFKKLFKKQTMGTWLVLTVMVETFWEVIENTTFVINIYRNGTISLDYVGDSIINSAGDTLFCILGFYLATKLTPKYILLLGIALELIALFWIRDNLTLNVIMLIYPLEVIKSWQAGG